MEIDEFPVEIFYKWWIFQYQEGCFTVLEGILIRRRRQLGKAVWSCFSRCLLKAGWLVPTVAGFTGPGRVWCRLQEGFPKIPRSEHGNPRGSSAWQGPAPDVLAVNTVIASNPPWVIAGDPRDLWKILESLGPVYQKVCGTYVSLVDFDWWFPHVSNMVLLCVIFKFVNHI